MPRHRCGTINQRTGAARSAGIPQPCALLNQSPGSRQPHYPKAIEAPFGPIRWPTTLAGGQRKSRAAKGQFPDFMGRLSSLAKGLLFQRVPLTACICRAISPGGKGTQRSAWMAPLRISTPRSLSPRRTVRIYSALRLAKFCPFFGKHRFVDDGRRTPRSDRERDTARLEQRYRQISGNWS